MCNSSAAVVSRSVPHLVGSSSDLFGRPPPRPSGDAKAQTPVPPVIRSPTLGGGRPRARRTHHTPQNGSQHLVATGRCGPHPVVFQKLQYNSGGSRSPMQSILLSILQPNHDQPDSQHRSPSHPPTEPHPHPPFIQPNHPKPHLPCIHLDKQQRHHPGHLSAHRCSATHLSRRALAAATTSISHFHAARPPTSHTRELQRPAGRGPGQPIPPLRR